MFFIISKLLSFLVTPIIWIVILLAVAILLKDKRKKQKVLIITLIFLYVFSNSFLLDEFMRKWEIPAIKDSEITQPYDAGIVLGGVITYDNKKDRFQFHRQGDRIIQAALLYKKGKIKKILFSGGAGALNKPEDKEGPHVHDFLLQMGIPESDILIEGESRNTRQNALLTKALLDSTIRNGRFLLITTGTHERRAIKCFEKVGVPVTPYSTDRFSGKRKFEFDHLLMPNAHTLFNWEFLTHEYAGYVVYKIVGYI